MKKSHILIVNPTKFLGNLLIGLGTIQRACAQFDEQGKPYTLIFDASYKPIVEKLFNNESLIYYPRSEINNGSFVERLKLYARLVLEIRRLTAYEAVDLEGDSVSRMLTLLSGADQRIGPEDCPRPSWYHLLSEPRQLPSEFYKYRNTMACIADVADLAPAYGKLIIPKSPEDLASVMNSQGLENFNSIVILHAGASKARKLWPNNNWIQLTRLLQNSGFQPVLIGAGDMDMLTNNIINEALESPIPDLANKLSLLDLTSLLSKANFYIGNDSGPMHLATALNVPAIAIFGPTNEKIWGPLLENTSVMRGFHCPAECRNGHNCELTFPCLNDLDAETVFEHFMTRIQALHA